MPIDLSPAGSPRPYPRRPRVWPWWFCLWLACLIAGSTAALLLWPAGIPASGPAFLLVTAGLPNAVVLFLFAIERAGYEARWYRTRYVNQHRDRWLADRIHDAQRPLQILGVGYCLPLNGQSLKEAISAQRPLPRQQTPRFGAGLIEHARFEDASWMIAAPFEAEPFESETTKRAPDDVIADAIDQPVPLAVAKTAQALEPLAESLLALTQYERSCWPQVRVVCGPREQALYGQQVRHALQLVGLPPLDVQAAASSGGLMIVDDWLDAHETRPLLVLAACWHDHGPPRGSTEGCVAVLLAPRVYRMPSRVDAIGVLHRPVQGETADDLHDTITHAAWWGRAELHSIARMWLTRAGRDSNTVLQHVGSHAATNEMARYRPDCVIGDLADGNGWLSIVAAIECGAHDGPQLVIDGAQAAIVRVHAAPSDSDLSLRSEARNEARNEDALA